VLHLYLFEHGGANVLKKLVLLLHLYLFRMLEILKKFTLLLHLYLFESVKIVLVIGTRYDVWSLCDEYSRGIMKTSIQKFYGT
jgi:hypothetical protein